MDEVKLVIHFMKRIMSQLWKGRRINQTDIGVVAPYSDQCKAIQWECRQNGFDNISVGSAEVFQGQERPIMIISTVRTDGRLGFVEDPRVNIPN